MFKKKSFSLLLSIILIISLSLVFIGCQKSTSEEDNQNNSDDKKFEGTEITALLPPWYSFPQEMLDEFEKETGIKVNLEITDWESMHDKLFTSFAAGVSPADLTEVSWYRVPSYADNGWFEPLKKYFDDDFYSDISTINMFGYKDDYYAIPIYNDFRLTYLNKKYFKEAGITENPETPDELLEAAVKIKESGACKYPITVPFSATTASTTPWFLLTKAYGGELFDENFEPLFDKKGSPGYKAMEFLMKGLHEYKVIDPASVGLEGKEVVEVFKEGNAAIDLAGWSGNITLYKNPEKSKIADDVEVIPVPGVHGKSRTYGLQEALGIPAASENKEAAAEFIKWLNKPENVKKLFLDMGIFPNHLSTVSELNNEGNLPGGETISKVLPTIENLFPQGAPTWYSDFRTEAATIMNQMAKGSISLDDGIKQITDKAREVAKDNK